MTYTRIFAVLLVFTVLSPNFAFGNTSFAKTKVGMMTYGFVDKVSQQHLSMAVWFPITATKSGTNLEGWRIPANTTKRVEAAFYPIVLLSHDVASDRFSNNDLAVDIASKGNIVIVPTHLGDNYSDAKEMYSANSFYTRPRHLLLALEKVLSSKELAPYADESRITVVGVGFGAVSALQLAGGKPDPLLINEFCTEGNKDPLCSPWVLQKINANFSELQDKIKEQGDAALLPPLSLYAPELVEVDLAYFEAEAEVVVPKISKKSAMANALYDFVGKDKRDGEIVEAISSQDIDSEEGEVLAFADGMPEDYIIAKDFQLTGVFGAVGKAQKVLVTPGPVDANFGEKIASREIAIASVMNNFKGRKHEFVFFRPASQRKILSVVLISPAGAMLFTKQSLSAIEVPVAIVDLSENELYPSAAHAKPFFTNLPFPPEVLTLSNTDHYSLFAPCTREMADIFGGMCGNISGEERIALAEKRNKFIGHFVKTSLGSALAVPEDSGFIDQSTFGMSIK